MPDGMNSSAKLWIKSNISSLFGKNLYFWRVFHLVLAFSEKGSGGGNGNKSGGKTTANSGGGDGESEDESGGNGGGDGSGGKTAAQPPVL